MVNRGHLKILKDTKLNLNEHELRLNHLGSILYHSGALEVPYSPNQFLDWDFFCRFLQHTGSNKKGASKISVFLIKKNLKNPDNFITHHL